MVRALISWSLHNRLIVILGTIVLIGVGLHSARNLNVEAYPDPTPPLVEVITQNPGASPEEMERLIASSTCWSVTPYWRSRRVSTRT
jgi:cobalt-zinc-cadmium resistance protein CzcA